MNRAALFSFLNIRQCWCFPRHRTSGNAIPRLTHAFSLSVSAEDPPMIVVRKFVHLLDQSDQDFQEELDLMKMREEVITLIRSNQQLENDLNLMDIKIGLLVKNKITLQVWSSASQGLGTLSCLIPLPPHLYALQGWLSSQWMLYVFFYVI